MRQRDEGGAGQAAGEGLGIRCHDQGAVGAQRDAQDGLVAAGEVTGT